MSSWQITGADGETILGNTHLPAGEAVGTVLLAHGFKGYKDYGMFPVVADAFADAGLITHRFSQECLAHDGLRVPRMKLKSFVECRLGLIPFRCSRERRAIVLPQRSCSAESLFLHPRFQELLREGHLLISRHTRCFLREEHYVPGRVIDRANSSRWQNRIR